MWRTANRGTAFRSPGVDIGRLDGVEEQLSHPNTLHVDEVGLEQSLRGLEPLPSHLDHAAIWQLGKRGLGSGWKEGERGRERTPVMVQGFRNREEAGGHG